MPMSIPEFRQEFPAFLDPQCYTDMAITFWASLAEKLHNQDRWGDLLPFGYKLFVAHQLTLEHQNNEAAENGNAPGQIQGAVSSGSVDKVSYSRDMSALDPADGHWNLTNYGIRWRQLAKMCGAGPMYVGAPGPDDLRSYGAWPGVIQPPFG